MARVWIYESEWRSMAQETACWTCETGGDLFGTWEPEPVILLATRLGPNSQREINHCRFDLPYVETLSRTLADDWGLDYFGDWHSHGVSDSVYPSRVDRERISRVLARTQFPRLLEFISARSGRVADSLPKITINGFDFPAERWFDPAALEITLIPGVSPLRSIFLLRADDGLGQDWGAWDSFPVSRIYGYQVDNSGSIELQRRQQRSMADCGFRQLLVQLELAFPRFTMAQRWKGHLEFTLEGADRLLLLRFDAHWPFPLFEIRLNELLANDNSPSSTTIVTALEPSAVIGICRQMLGGPAHDVVETADAATGSRSAHS